MSPMLRAYLSLTAANVRMYVRNPVASFTLTATLVALLVLFKLILGGQGAHTKVVVSDGSGGPEAAALVKDLRAVPTFDVSEAPAATARQRLEQGDSDLAIAIPSGFVGRDAAGHIAPVTLDVTYRAGSAGEASVPALKGVVEGYAETVLGAVPPVTVAASALRTRPTSPIDFFLPGVLAFNIVGSALMLAAGTFGNYKATGVLRRLKATGISPTVFVLAHASASFVLGALQTVAILVAAALLFSVHLDLPGLFVLLALGYLAFLAMGLAIGGWIRDSQRASVVAQSLALPMIFVGLLSAALPAGVTAVTRYLPISYVTDGVQHLGQGAQLGALVPDVAWLAAWAAVLLVAAGRVFRWE
jgi:ABC-2 type transport system permease protein